VALLILALLAYAVWTRVLLAETLALISTVSPVRV
jgi:hypothetical protein